MVRSRHRRYLAAVTLIGGVILGVVAAPASASTAALVELPTAPCKPIGDQDVDCPQDPETALVYVGGREDNRVTLTSGAQQVFIHDPRAEIEPGPGCTRVDSHRVSCSEPKAPSQETGVSVATGRGADRVVSELGSAISLILDGGPGDDVLAGDSGSDALFGGQGADRLRGRAGADSLYDASPRAPDEGALFFFRASPDFTPPDFTPPGGGRDSFDGGAGRDAVSYEGRSAKLRVDLASRAAAAGARRERDSIKGVEDATGGAGDDRLAGTRQANSLRGGSTGSTTPTGDDRISGRGGADTIDPGDGRNAASGGAGDDRISGRGGRDRVSCGSGTDLVGDLSRKDFLAPDCEKPGFDFLDALLGGPLEVRSLLPLREGRPPRVLKGSLGCFPDFVCEVKAEVRVRGAGIRRGTAPPRGTLLGSHHFTIEANETKSLDLRLSSTGLRRLRRHRALRVTVSLGSQHSDRGPSSYLTVLRFPGKTRSGAGR